MTVSRPLNLVEKLILKSTIGGDVEDFRPGAVVLLKVDWILASELSWTGMDTLYDRIGRPPLPRPERFWLAADHIVDPRINHLPKVKRFIDSAERIAREQPIDYQPPNTTIMHTEFARERAQPGQVIIGSDSHSCSAGCVGALAMGLGSTDTLLALITGRTFLQIPEVICIRLEGIPPPGVGGKDVVLHILGTLKRNTVAMERAVEITGPGLKHLSTDARFAICNMMTEFGGLTGVCTPDSETSEYINMRKDDRHKGESVYLKADEGCSYAGVYTIDLSEVSSLVALFPSPDNTIPAKDLVAGEGLKLDGCFIGACTTAFEDLVLGALVLEQAMADGVKPIDRGVRKVTPGSKKIIQSLEQHKLLDVYRQAGFEIGIPGCSYCVGLGADKAKEGEVWLSSQNRNFRNRMGTGSIANLASAATVALSSFDMNLRDPGDYLNRIDRKRLARICGKNAVDLNFEPEYTSSVTPSLAKSTGETNQSKAQSWPKAITSGVQRFGDSVDTDSISPGDLLMKATEAKSDEETGEVCFYHDRPEYRSKARNGYSILVAGEGFGCGSSRETAATAIKGCGTQAIIAKSYSFIFRRNAANNALPALQIEDETFYTAVDEVGEAAELTIYFETAEVAVKGRNERWKFMMSAVDGDLLRKGGAMQAYSAYGQSMYD